MQATSGHRLRCVDCGTSDNDRGITEHLGAASARHNEGHVQVQRVALCANCAGTRLAEQEEIPLFG
jgi:hypothetical protein